MRLSFGRGACIKAALGFVRRRRRRARLDSSCYLPIGGRHAFSAHSSLSFRPAASYISQPAFACADCRTCLCVRSPFFQPQGLNRSLSASSSSGFPARSRPLKSGLPQLSNSLRKKRRTAVSSPLGFLFRLLTSGAAQSRNARSSINFQDTRGRSRSRRRASGRSP